MRSNVDGRTFTKVMEGGCCGGVLSIEGGLALPPLTLTPYQREGGVGGLRGRSKRDYRVFAQLCYPLEKGRNKGMI